MFDDELEADRKFKWRLGPKAKRILTFVIIVLLVGPVLAMTGLYASGTWRYKLIVEVETPEGVKTGYAVREVSNSNSNIKILDLPEAGNPAEIRGEAVVVDLGERGVLFALIDHNSDHELYSAFPSEKGPSTVAGIRHYNSLRVGQKAPVAERYIPKMVMFEDIGDARSVQLVYGQVFNDEAKKNELVNNFEEFFGSGVKLKSVKAEKTNESLTKINVLEELPKFDDEFWKWLKTLKYGDPRRISGANFKKGYSK